jgi:molybdate transport system substrate-binding protein
MHLHLLSGGAAQGLVEALAERLAAQTGYAIAGSFGAVGAMAEKFLAGAAADLLILTAPMIRELAQQGHVDAASIEDVGRVRTAVAVPSGAPAPPIDTADRLRAAVMAADAIYVPDPERATAGIHFARVLAELGITGALLAAKARIHANGSAAMRALAGAGPRALGATQATEILSTPGVRLVGALPAPFDLATVYTLALSARAQAPEPARVLAKLLTGPDSGELRTRLGFEPLSFVGLRALSAPPGSGP